MSLGSPCQLLLGIVAGISEGIGRLAPCPLIKVYLDKSLSQGGVGFSKEEQGLLGQTEDFFREPKTLVKELNRILGL